ncbi:MAG: hemerythrin family protein [Holophagae bacterium]|jgi:hemerythrin
MLVELPDQLLTGIEGVDDQHRALIRWARAVGALGTAERHRATVRRAAEFMIAYAKFHFASEEYAMAASGFVDLDQHRRDHAMMRRQLSTLGNAFEDEGADVTTPVAGLQQLISSWIRNHISSADVAFARFCEQRPETRFVELPSPNELLQMGGRVDNVEQVEEVHAARDDTDGEISARFVVR